MYTPANFFSSVYSPEWKTAGLNNKQISYFFSIRERNVLKRPLFHMQYWICYVLILCVKINENMDLINFVFIHILTSERWITFTYVSIGHTAIFCMFKMKSSKWKTLNTRPFLVWYLPVYILLWTIIQQLVQLTVSLT